MRKLAIQWFSESISLNAETENLLAFGEIRTAGERRHLVKCLKVMFRAGDYEPVLAEDLTQADAGR